MDKTGERLSAELKSVLADISKLKQNPKDELLRKRFEMNYSNSPLTAVIRLLMEETDSTGEKING